MVAVVDRENGAVCVENVTLVRARSPTLSKLYLGKRAAQGLEQGVRSNVRTPTSTVRTLLGPTPALSLLLEQRQAVTRC